MLSATRIRLYPNVTQRSSLAQQFGCARWVWNEALAETQRLYRETGKGLTYETMTVRLPKLKQRHDWLGEAVAQALQQSLRNLARAFTNFFQGRARYPRFKSRHERQSVQFPQAVRMTDGGIVLPKLGRVAAVVHRKITGAVKTVTVMLEPCGHYYASVLTEDGAVTPEPIFTPDTTVLGVDVGLTELAVTSTGRHIPNPRHVGRAERNLKRKQQSLSRKKKGSNSRNKARRLVARCHERVKNARNDFLHKWSRRLVDESQAIAVEDLCVKAMVKAPTLAKSISDASWGMLTSFLAYKCEWAGKLFVRTGRFFPSSKACSACGSVQASMPLGVRHWTCSDCGTHHHRDENAAKNIAAEGWRTLMAGGTPASAVRGTVSRT